MRFKRSSGVLAHPTSFPSKYGIGDLGAGAEEFLVFLEKSGQKLWQVLPLGPTSFGDSPYQSFSTFAGNPILISPDILMEQGFICENDLQDIPQFDAIKVDYGCVIEYKTKLYKKAFLKFNKNIAAYKKFCKENADWLDDYSLFVSIKNYFITERKTGGKDDYESFKADTKGFLTENQIMDYYYGAVWASWPDELKNRKKSTLAEWSEKLSEEINYQKFLQYEFFRQWANIKKLAKGKNIEIIGDIPIFVALDSSDVWSNPELFYLDEKGFPTEVAGVPPDYFSETGQLWGNPLYNWKEHKKAGYSWWIKRIARTLSIVDILRIDHFRGFDEYWSVPIIEKTAINGKWIKGPGKGLFLEIQKALGELPIIAEDLGIITDSVRKLKNSLNFPGMRVLQFAFNSAEPSDHLPHLYENPNMVVYTGTHDNDTSKGWYLNADEAAKDYFRRYTNSSGDDAAWSFIRLAMSATADITIVPVQDLLQQGSDCRMNVPGVAENNWQYRYETGMLTDSISEGLKYLTKLFNRL